MHFNKPYRTFPLRTTLVVAVVTTALIVIGIVLGAVGLPAYGKAKKVVHGLWEDIAEQVALNATEQVLRYFQNAPITLKVIKGLVEEEQLPLDNFETMMDVCYRMLKENPEFMTVFYSKKDGTFYGVFRFPNRIEGSYRVIGADGKTTIKNYKIGADSKWIQTEETKGDYDPRNRPYWKAALAHPEGGWSEPYKFATTGEKGYTYVLGQNGKKGGEGYWAVNFQIDRLGDFLRSLKVGGEGVVYIIADDGAIIAESSGHDSEAIKEAWGKYVASGMTSGSLPLEHRIFYANRFPKEFDIPWSVITSIHEDDFLKPIRTHAFQSLKYGLIPCILFLFLVAAFFGRVSRRLKEIAWEMDEVSNLTFRFRPSDELRSRIREVNAMNHGLNKMKVGLQSFAKYVPIDLIKKLILSGHAAALGAEKREVTVFFADMAGFTSMAENLQPDEVAKVIEEFLTGSSEEVHKEKGIIDKFMGDAVMALWGVPDPISNPALAACRTALSMRRKFQSNPRMKHRIGINTGIAMVGNFGSDARMDYTALGDTINIAARLEKINKKYDTTILMGPDTASVVKEVMLVRPVDWILLEGRVHPLLAYELMGEKKEMPESVIEAVSIYTSALEAYQNKHFKEAADLFDKANALFGGSDTPSMMMAQQCRKF